MVSDRKRQRRVPPPQAGRGTPPTDTLEEARYLRRLSDTKRQVLVHLRDKSIAQGWIEYFDRDFIRLTRDPGPNLFIFKREIVYLAELPDRRRSNATTENGRESNR